MASVAFERHLAVSINAGTMNGFIADIARRRCVGVVNESAVRKFRLLDYFILTSTPFSQNGFQLSLTRLRSLGSAQ